MNDLHVGPYVAVGDAERLALALAAMLAAGCSAATAAHRPDAQHATATVSTAQLIAQAAQSECEAFSVTYGDIRTNMQIVHNLADLIAVLGLRGAAWERSLSRAARLAGSPSVPIGNNQARRLAVDIARDALDVSEVSFEIDTGKIHMIRRTWNETFADLSVTAISVPVGLVRTSLRDLAQSVPVVPTTARRPRRCNCADGSDKMAPATLSGQR